MEPMLIPPLHKKHSKSSKFKSCFLPNDASSVYKVHTQTKGRHFRSRKSCTVRQSRSQFRYRFTSDIRLIHCCQIVFIFGLKSFPSPIFYEPQCTVYGKYFGLTCRNFKVRLYRNSKKDNVTSSLLQHLKTC